MSPLLLLSLFILSAVCLEVQFKDVIVVQENQVSTHWKPGTNTVVVDRFEANSIFWTSLDVSESLGDIELYVTTGQDICLPEIKKDAAWNDDYYYESSYYEYYGTQIDVIYHCQKSGVATFQMVIPVKIETQRGQTTKRIEIAWSKNCASGARSGLHVGTEESLQDVVKDGVVLDSWKSGKKSIPASAVLTNFFLRVEHGSQTYSIKLDYTNPEIVEVHSRGYAGVPNIVVDTDWDHDLSILYHCFKTGKSTVTLSLLVPPFDEMKWTWEKVCGGEHEGGINIGFTPATAGIFRDGQLVPSFSKFVAKATDRKTDFYLYMTEKVRQQYDGIVITSSPGGVMKPYVRINDEIDVTPKTGFITDHPVKMSIYYDCLKRADAQITVSLLLPPYKMVEFTWQKRCVKLNPIDDSGSWTGGQLVALFVVFTIALALSAVFLKNYSKERKLN